MMDTQDKINEVKIKLARYAEEQGLPESAVKLMDTLIENNVSYNNVDTFCEEHFILPTVADYYKGFFQYMLEQTPKTDSPGQSDVQQLIMEIRKKLDLLEQLIV